MALLNNYIESGVARGVAARGWPALIAAILLLSACVTIPIQEMSDARQAIAGAEDAGAERYAAHSLNSAERLMVMAETDLAAKDYTHAREAAIEAKKFALRARDLGGAFQRVTVLVAEAAAIGTPVAEPRQLLDDAQRAATAGDEPRAGELLQRAQQDISVAQQQTYDQQARLLIEACAVQERTMSLPQQSTLAAARGALRDGDVEQAYELARGLATEMDIYPDAKAGTGGDAGEDTGSRGDGG
jgi:hypothetical protein